MSSEFLAGAFGQKTREVVPVHLHGQCADVGAIASVCAGRGIEIVEDCAVRPLARLEGRRHVFHLFVVEAPDRDVLGAHLDKAGVATLIHYPTPIHRLPPDRRLADGPVPRDDEVERIVDALGTVA